MLLPKFIYEKLPYIYLSFSVYLITRGTEVPLVFSSLLFYAAACVVFVTRSYHRRNDRQTNLDGTHFYPAVVYEYLPYVNSAVGIIILFNFSNLLLLFTANVLILVSMRNLLCRRSNRKRVTSLF